MNTIDWLNYTLNIEEYNNDLESYSPIFAEWAMWANDNKCVILKKDGQFYCHQIKDEYYYTLNSSGDIDVVDTFPFVPHAIFSPEPIIRGYDDKYYFESLLPEEPLEHKISVIEEKRKQYRRDHCDDITSQMVRKKALGIWTTEDEKKYLEEMLQIEKYLDENFPYPVQ